MSALVKYFASGILSIVPLLLLLYFGVINEYALQKSTGLILTYYFLAGLEELQKSLPALHQKQKHFNLTYCVCVGLGFAFIENIFYSYGISSVFVLLVVNVTRLLLGSSIHALSTATVGISYLYFRRQGGVYTTWIPSILAVLFGALIHFSFNFLQLQNLHFLNIPLLVIVISSLSFVYKYKLVKFA